MSFLKRLVAASGLSERVLREYFQGRASVFNRLVIEAAVERMRSSS